MKPVLFHTPSILPICATNNAGTSSSVADASRAFVLSIRGVSRSPGDDELPYCNFGHAVGLYEKRMKGCSASCTTRLFRRQDPVCAYDEGL